MQIKSKKRDLFSQMSKVFFQFVLGYKKYGAYNLKFVLPGPEI